MSVDPAWPHKSEARVRFEGFEVAVFVGSKDGDAAQAFMDAVREVVMTRAMALFPPQVPPPCKGCGQGIT